MCVKQLMHLKEGRALQFDGVKESLIYMFVAAVKI